MALYSFSAQWVGITHKLKNCVSAAAYRAGERLLDERSGEVHNYSGKAVEHSEILAPDGAPAWVLDRHKLWNACEMARNRVLGITAREIRIALPRELGRAQQVELVRRFLREEFVAAGMVADWSLHDEADKNQPHVHVMLTTRALTSKGFGNQVRAWDHKKALRRWREQWAVHANHTLERAGHEERIDHRSYRERGIDLAPQPKLYRHPDHVERDGRDLVREKFEEFQETARENGERILRDPTIPIRLLTQQRATFRREDLLKVLNTHTLDAAQFDACLHAVMQSPELVELPTGRFTSREMLATEERMLAFGKALHASAMHEVADRYLQDAMRVRSTLSDEQRNALESLSSSRGLVMLQGHAGTGKSFLLSAAREAWEAAGMKVVGGALAGKAAEGLALSSGIEARTLASWERAWSLGHDALTDKHVLVIDEAGMLGTRQLARVLETAREVGAKVVLVGDSRQLQAIEAGSPFRVLSEQLGAETLREIRRQRVDWQREASMAFADGRAGEALGAYHHHGHVKAHLTTEETRRAVVQAWAEGLEGTPIHEQIIYAYRRDDVRALNELARQVRRARGELGDDHRVETEHGERAFAEGDRVYFGRNSRQLDVKNGTLGTVERVEGHHLTVRLDGHEGRRLTVDLRAYAHVDHGYALTVHKSQGATVDRAYVMASKLFDASTAYVAMSRHRDHVELHWARDEFGTRAALDHVLSRERPKELALEQLEDPRRTLHEVLQDESRFALLSPDAQKTLIGSYARAYEQLKAEKPMLGLREELAAHPVLVAARTREAQAAEAYTKASMALAEYQETKRNLPWYRAMKQPESVFVEAEARAKEAYWKARHAHEALQRDPASHQEVSARVAKNNRSLLKHEQRIAGWRAQVDAVAQAGLREHVLEQVEKKFGRSVRWASERDQRVKLEVVGATAFEVPLHAQRETHGLVLKAPDGSLVVAPVSAYTALRQFKVGMQAELEQNHRGFMIMEGRSRGWSR
jgi:Ti-type conjugative transfer relaxase TraA